VTEQDLKDCMKKIAMGDKNAFRDFASELGQEIFALCYNFMNRNSQDAEDMVQNTLIRLWQQAPNYKDTGSVTAWVMTVAHNICMDEWRKRKKDRLTQDLNDHITDPKDIPFDTLSKQQDRMYLLRLVDQLPKKERQVLLLNFVDHFTHKQISEILNISQKSAEHHYYRGLERLKHEHQKRGLRQ
jgi:RNA polymerase sigma factor (sigma-70 family)